MIEKYEQTTERRKRLENTIKSAGLPRFRQRDAKEIVDHRDRNESSWRWRRKINTGKQHAQRQLCTATN